MHPVVNGWTIILTESCNITKITISVLGETKNKGSNTGIELPVPKADAAADTIFHLFARPNMEPYIRKLST